MANRRLDNSLKNTSILQYILIPAHLLYKILAIVKMGINSVINVLFSSNSQIKADELLDMMGGRILKAGFLNEYILREYFVGKNLPKSLVKHLLGIVIKNDR